MWRVGDSIFGKAGQGQAAGVLRSPESGRWSEDLAVVGTDHSLKNEESCLLETKRHSPSVERSTGVDIGSRAASNRRALRQAGQGKVRSVPAEVPVATHLGNT